VEGDGDRLVYNTVWETLSKELMPDVHFAAVGGTGGIADTCRLYRTLNIPVAVIADLDLVVDLQKMQNILESMTDVEQAKMIVEKTRYVADEIRKLPPTIGPDDYARRLEKIRHLPTVWETGDDLEIQRELRSLAQGLDRMRGLKRRGISSLPDSISTSLQEILLSLERVGVFLVPVGEVEGWLAAEGIADSKEKKAARANAAALTIQAKGACHGDIWDFVRGVGNFLR
jgi:hypothetical protein